MHSDWLLELGIVFAIEESLGTSLFTFFPDQHQALRRKNFKLDTNMNTNMLSACLALWV